MFCSKCGKEIRADQKFCASCGAPNDSWAPDAPVAPEAPAEQPVVETAIPEAPAEQPFVERIEPAAPAERRRPAHTPSMKKGLGKGAVLGVAAAAVALVVLLGVLIASLSGGPKAKLGKAAAKSVKAYMSAADAVGMPDLGKLYASKKVTQSGSIELRSAPDGLGVDAEALKGAGFRFTSGCDLSGKRLDLSCAAFFGSADLIAAEAELDDTVLSVYVPELFDGTAYGLDTGSLGRDLDKVSDGELPEEYRKLSFNLFDILKQLDFEPLQVDKSANKAFLKAIEVKKTGTASIDVNGNALKCAQYHVVIPKDAMKDYVDALKDAYKKADYDEKLIEALRSTGLDKDILSSLEDEIRSSYSQGADSFSELRDSVKAFGDLELDVYLNGGYISAVLWEGEIDGERGELSLYLGGGKNYVDDLSLELRGDGARVTVTSNGDHAAKSGTFTDSTAVRVKGGRNDESIKSEMEYRPKQSSDNFSWRVKAGGETFKADGTLAMSRDSLDMQLDDVSLSDGSGEKQFAVRLGWSIGPYSAQKISASETQMLSSMSRSDVEDLAENISGSAMRWVGKMYEEYADVFHMLGGVF